jgi:mono/diheme cytochrome c family protein
VRVSGLATALLLLAVAGTAQVSRSSVSYSGEKPKQSPVATGKYIVENVAMCSTCHTPRLPNGALNQTQALMGGHLAFSVPRTRRWASDAPRIAGLSRWEDPEIVILLTTGKLETGLAMRSPMPQFHMTEEDARAVVAYLRSLAPLKKKNAKLPRTVAHR